MENYKEMYRELFIATTKAIDILVEAQKKCEDLYIEAGEKEKVISIMDKLREKEI